MRTMIDMIAMIPHDKSGIRIVVFVQVMCDADSVTDLIELLEQTISEELSQEFEAATADWISEA